MEAVRGLVWIFSRIAHCRRKGTCIGVSRIFGEDCRSRCEVKKWKTPSSEEENWQQQLADELHKPIKRNFTRWHVIVNHIDEIWCADLVEMQQFNKWNKGY